MSNVKSGAYFACVSDATRNDLLNVFPEVRDRAVTIHNMVSHHYYMDPGSSAQLVPGIVRSRLHGLDSDAKDMGLSPKFLTLREQEKFYEKALQSAPLKYLLVVSTVEPRKNHARLIAAWEVLKAEVDPNLKLVVVGTLGWDYKQLVKGFRTWIDRGELFMLNAVPAPDLRVLYRHATATVCPSLGEGFDFSGVESMRSGGVVIASDIAAHREIYADAAEYFNPYSTASLVRALNKVIYASDAERVQDHLRLCGQEVAGRYVPEKILPQWTRFLSRVLQERGSPAFGAFKAPELRPEATVAATATEEA
jgi:glycosyltransferase involved in cell wall biosynthesis